MTKVLIVDDDALVRSSLMQTVTTQGLELAHFEGPRVTLGLCAYLDDGVTTEDATLLLEEAWAEEAARYGVAIRIRETRRWKRPVFAADGILAALRQEPLGPPCDRLMAFVRRHAGDLVWSLFLPQGARGRGRGDPDASVRGGAAGGPRASHLAAGPRPAPRAPPHGGLRPRRDPRHLLRAHRRAQAGAAPRVFSAAGRPRRERRGPRAGGRAVLDGPAPSYP